MKILFLDFKHIGMFLSLCICSCSLSAQEFAKLFTDHMVLQRDQEIRVWGTGSSGTAVKVALADEAAESMVAADGRWMVTLAAMPAGGPYEMTMTGSEKHVALSDVMLGDVWLCSGQSNMEWTVENSNDAGSVIEEASDHKIRHFKVPHGHAWEPDHDLEGGPWAVASPETVSKFTAVGYFFAQNIRMHEDVTIGLLNSSWGGSRIEPWMRAEVLGMDATSFAAELKKKQEQEEAETKARLTERFGPLPEKDMGLVGEDAVWADPEYADTDWSDMEIPGLWESRGLPGLDGIVWLRKTIELSEDQIGGQGVLSLGKVDDGDITWINGEKVGETNGYNVHRVYNVKEGLLKPGKNVITVRANDYGGGGGIWGEPDQLYLTLGGDKFSLAGDWKMKIGEVLLSLASRMNHTPTALYNKMIHPLLDFPVKGALWYQGESNAGLEEAHSYRTKFRTMITDWRKLWDIGDFPFLFVQLANFKAVDSIPAESGWALLRESQTDALGLPATGQAVIIDIGEADDIHPRNKQDVGYRLSLAARKLAYGESNIVHQGPVYQGYEKRDDAILVQLDAIGSEMVSKSKYGYLKGFAIAGADKEFHWAQARFVDGGILVTSPHVTEPVAVRYAWGDNPEDANLYNAEGLPASPFRTDDW